MRNPWLTFNAVRGLRMSTSNVFTKTCLALLSATIEHSSILIRDVRVRTSFQITSDFVPCRSRYSGFGAWVKRSIGDVGFEMKVSQ